MLDRDGGRQSNFPMRTRGFPRGVGGIDECAICVGSNYGHPNRPAMFPRPRGGRRAFTRGPGLFPSPRGKRREFHPSPGTFPVQGESAENSPGAQGRFPAGTQNIPPGHGGDSQREGSTQKITLMPVESSQHRGWYPRVQHFLTVPSQQTCSLLFPNLQEREESPKLPDHSAEGWWFAR